MSNHKHVLERLQIPTNSVNAAVQTTRERIVNEDDPIAASVKFINSVITVPDVTISFEDEFLARLTAQALVEAIILAGDSETDSTTLYLKAQERAKGLREEPRLAFIYTKDVVDVDGVGVRHGEELKTMAGTDVKVLVKANGKIKKGGKQVLAAELYRKHVLEAKTPATNQEFISILVKQLDMSKSGATTYAYNCKKQLGEPAGGIVKAKKGRKAK